MPDENGAEKKHEASPKKRENAFKEGQIGLGRDLVLVGGTGAGLLALSAAAPAFVSTLVHAVEQSCAGIANPNPAALMPALRSAFFLVVFVGASAALGATAVTLAQTRFGFWGKLAMPDFSRLVKGGKMKRLFNGEALMDVGLQALKVTGVAGVTTLALEDDLLTLSQRALGSPRAEIFQLFSPLAPVAFRVLIFLTIVGGIDLALSRMRQSKQMKMTDEELKREHKDEEGDGLIRSRRRDRHRQLVRGRLELDVPRADVVVVNPTHIAIALRYRPADDAAPRVLAKGKGEAADRIRALARENGIPIYKDVLLARLLFRKVEIGRSVPAETFEAVAAILAWVWRLQGNLRGGGAAKALQAPPAHREHTP